MKEEELDIIKNGHYSEQTGHLQRGEHKKVVIKLGGIMPEALPGYEGITERNAWLVRRTMRRIARTGKK